MGWSSAGRRTVLLVLEIVRYRIVNWDLLLRLGLLEEGTLAIDLVRLLLHVHLRWLELTWSIIAETN